MADQVLREATHEAIVGLGDILRGHAAALGKLLRILAEREVISLEEGHAILAAMEQSGEAVSDGR